MTPDAERRRGRPWRTPLSASIDSRSSAAPTNRTPGPTPRPAPASSPGFGRPPARPALAGAASSRAARPGARRSAPRARRACVAPTGRRAARSSAANRSSTSASAATPVTASIRRMPEPMLRSPVMTKLPIWPLARQWVPPHSSWLKPSTRIVRTCSPYFSSKNASAPAAWASAIVIHSIETGRSSRTMTRTSASIAALLVVGQRPVEREVEAQVVGMHERAGLPRRLADDVARAPDGAGACRCGCASCRRGARHRRPRGRVSPTATRPCRTPAVDGQARRLRARHALDVVDLEQRRRAVADATSIGRRRRAPCQPTRRRREHELPGVGDLAAALGVERGPVEHDLGAAAASARSSTSATASSVSYSMPSRRIATTRASAVVVS